MAQKTPQNLFYRPALKINMYNSATLKKKFNIKDEASGNKLVFPKFVSIFYFACKTQFLP